MALDKDRLGTAIANAIAATSAGGDLSAAEKTEIENQWKVIADEIIKEFVNNAVVTTSVAVASVSGVTAGGANSGPGTGTGTGTVA